MFHNSGMATTRRRIFACLTAYDVSIERFRADSGSYLEDAIEVIEVDGERIYIRVRRSAVMNRQIGQTEKENQFNFQN